MELLHDKTVFITGGSRGIGKAICLEFARHGADIAFNYSSNDEAASEVVAQVEALGRKCLAYKGSVAESGVVKEMFKQFGRDFARLDILVNNAGIKKDGLFIMMKDKSWQDILAVNLDGVFFCCRAAAKLMMRHKSGSIINVTSLSGEMGQAGQANYATTKGGVIAFTKSVARELAGYGIRANCLSPGFIDTEMLGDVPDDILSKNKQLIPLQRFGSPAEVASAALFLASDLSTYVTGEVLKVNGGLYM